MLSVISLFIVTLGITTCILDFLEFTTIFFTHHFLDKGRTLYFNSINPILTFALLLFFFYLFFKPHKITIILNCQHLFSCIYLFAYSGVLYSYLTAFI